MWEILSIPKRASNETRKQVNMNCIENPKESRRHPIRIVQNKVMSELDPS